MKSRTLRIRMLLLKAIAIIMGMSMASCEPAADLYGCPEVDYRDVDSVDREG